ncbi:MAG: Gfo/Idh/MocA family oxidoreductase [Planctomycetes bacterium]|nr:Gfo/Idh/MocA family oxidoreductase [Planctomycetota bacterium]
MTKMKLKAAVLGLDGAGEQLLELASRSQYFDVEAVGDKNTKLAERMGREYNCASFDDYRQLIIQNDLDCLLVSAGLYSCARYLPAAIKKGFNIFKLGPPARDFEEAAGLLRTAQSEGVKFVVASGMRFSESFARFRELITKPQQRISLIRGVCNTGTGSIVKWHTDPKLSGGGVLLRNCYELVDQIVYNFGIPQQVSIAAPAIFRQP